jgi:hypothetical protein
MRKNEISAYFRRIFANNFFGAFFLNFFNGFEISLTFCVFETHIEFLNKNFFLLLLALFVNFDCKCARLKKMENLFYACVLGLN